MLPHTRGDPARWAPRLRFTGRVPPKRRQRRTNLAVEPMEGRALLSVLTLSGDLYGPADDTIRVSIDYPDYRATVTLDDAPAVDYSLAGIDSLIVAGLLGNDTISVGILGQGSLPITLDGGEGDDQLYGGSPGEMLIGGPGNDLLVGDGGNATYVFQAATAYEVDTVAEQPGGGTDTLDFSGLPASQPVSVNLASTTNVLAYHANRMVLLQSAGQAANFENVIGGAGNDRLIGNAAANALLGGDGNDALTGGDDDDTLDGGGGDDRLDGGAGNDRLRGGPGDDVYIFRAPAMSETDTVSEQPGAGTDTLHFGNLPASIPVTVNLSGLTTTLASTTNGAVIVRAQSAGQAANFENVIGGAGNDRLIGNAAVNRLDGGSGDDTLISVGGGQSDTLVGGMGSDGFWADSENTERIEDAEAAEIAGGNVHRIGSFYTLRVTRTGATMPVSRELNGQDLLDPYTSYGTYMDYSNRPLVASAGPTQDDVFQGSVGDCYFVAALGSVALTDPNRIRQTVVDLGDGTYALRLFSNYTTEYYIRVDNGLPSWSAGQPSYAKLGAEGSMWVPIIEKAWAFVRRNDGNYASTDTGNPYEAFGLLGSTTNFWGTWQASSGTQVLSYIQGQLAAGKAVTALTPSSVPAGIPLIGFHAYTVIGVLLDSQGNPVKLRLRNPWGFDGTGSDDNPGDGYVTVSADQALRGLIEVESAYV